MEIAEFVLNEFYEVKKEKKSVLVCPLIYFSTHFTFLQLQEQLKCATPVNSQFGLRMLQKMGWNPGEGLGKNKEGSLTPLMLDVKMDKKGFHAQEELTPQKPAIPMAKSLAGKHPVSALVELCNKQKWLPPVFEVIYDTGPDHKKNYLMKVTVNNQEYKPSCSSSTKKYAKAIAAAACLAAMGIIPPDSVAETTSPAEVVVSNTQTPQPPPPPPPPGPCQPNSGPPCFQPPILPPTGQMRMPPHGGPSNMPFMNNGPPYGMTMGPQIPPPCPPSRFPSPLSSAASLMPPPPPPPILHPHPPNS